MRPIFPVEFQLKVRFYPIPVYYHTQALLFQEKTTYFGHFAPKLLPHKAHFLRIFLIRSRPRERPSLTLVSTAKEKFSENEPCEAVRHKLPS